LFSGSEADKKSERRELIKETISIFIRKATEESGASKRSSLDGTIGRARSVSKSKGWLNRKASGLK
jgi:hypothetical protein